MELVSPFFVTAPGEVTEWLMVLVLKTSVGRLTEGSNPSLSARLYIKTPSFWRDFCFGVAQARGGDEE